MNGPAASHPEIEQMVIADRYRVEKLLGQGGMGAVYAAFDPVSQRRVALKLLLSDVHERAVALFEREYQTLVSLKHPRIVEVYDYGHSAQGSYYTMELLEGSDLSKRAPMPWREACACIRDVASILGVLHVRGLVHRDLSPRNLWLTPDGRLKLLDFGALTPFGVASEVMGTPPFVPPEALRGERLDARSDLYALGALAYWLLTSVHAYPAKSLGELQALWTREPANPNNLVRLLNGAASDDPLPSALVDLLRALLRLDPEQRLGSTAELIDRVSAIADLAPEGVGVAAQSYLESKLFVGRLRERERFVELLAEAERGKVQALMIEGAAGVGRSRLLDEMAVTARIAGATTVVLRALRTSQPFALASALVEHLIAARPDAERAARERAELLGQLSPALRTALGATQRPSLAPGRTEARVRLQTVLQEWLLELTRDRLLVLFVDDLQLVDEESQALLAVVARETEAQRLLLVSSVLREGSSELSPLSQSLRDVSSGLRLLPLSGGETLELLRSVFGAAPYLERLAERFHRLSHGNPGHCLELSQHLVQVGAARYADGYWVLPAELAGTDLPQSRAEGIAGRLKQLSPRARRLAELLSIPHHGPLSRALCLALAEAPAAETPRLLDELTRANVMVGSAGSYLFAHEVLQQTLHATLDAKRAREAHLRCADTLLRGSDHDQGTRLRAGLHLIRGGEFLRGEKVQVEVGQELLEAGDLDTLHNDGVLFEEGYALLRLAGRDDYALATHLTVLACCSYLVHRRYGKRYGNEAIRVLEGILKLAVARRLRNVLGARDLEDGGADPRRARHEARIPGVGPPGRGDTDLRTPRKERARRLSAAARQTQGGVAPAGGRRRTAANRRLGPEPRPAGACSQYAWRACASTGGLPRGAGPADC